MVTARTLKGAQVYVTFYPDCEENVGGYYCPVSYTHLTLPTNSLV